MADPITLGTIAALAGKAAIGALAAMPVKAAAGKLTQKARNALTRGPLTGPLEKALSAASRAFIETFDVFIADEQTRANLKVMVEDQRWAHAVAQLPLLHPEKIDTSSFRVEAGLPLGLPKVIAHAPHRSVRERFAHTVPQ